MRRADRWNWCCAIPLACRFACSAGRPMPPRPPAPILPHVQWSRVRRSHDGSAFRNPSLAAAWMQGARGGRILAVVDVDKQRTSQLRRSHCLPTFLIPALGAPPLLCTLVHMGPQAVTGSQIDSEAMLLDRGLHSGLGTGCNEGGLHLG